VGVTIKTIPGQNITTCYRCQTEITDETRSKYAKTIVRVTETRTPLRVPGAAR
jgi:hypothetical protein